MSEKTADDTIKLAKDEHVESVDVRFCDLPGIMQHFTIPISFFDADIFENGIAFDGSSIRGFQAIHESDMLLLPDPDTAQIDLFNDDEPSRWPVRDARLYARVGMAGPAPLRVLEPGESARTPEVHIGFLTGDLDTCIHIRTVVVKDGVAYIQAGGGTVADAKPAYEFEESVAKSRAMLQAIELACSQPDWG